MNTRAHSRRVPCPRRAPVRPAPPSAFTLLELLVVVSIVLVLAGLLLPAAMRARDRSLALGCLSNERQIALGIEMYSQENGDTWPWVTPDTQFRQWSVLRHHASRSRILLQCPAARGSSRHGPRSLARWTNAATARLRNSSTITNQNGSVWITDYKLNDNPRFFATNALGHIEGPRAPLSHFRPSELVAVWDNLDWMPRHASGTRVNLGFLDGHAESMPATGSRPSLAPARALSGTYTVDRIGNFPFWNWGFPDVHVAAEFAPRSADEPRRSKSSESR